MQTSVTQFGWPYTMEDGLLVPETPMRRAGQQHAVGLTAPPMDEVRVAFVGLGLRGAKAAQRWMRMKATRIIALCDNDLQRAEQCQSSLNDAGIATYGGPDGYKKLMQRADIDLVYVATDWQHHFAVAREALQCGKHVAVEVPAALSLSEIWQLIDLAEQRRLHCTILENCCYDDFELRTLRLARRGDLGEILRVAGGYLHDLSEKWGEYAKLNDKDKLGWRLDINRRFRGDLYASHGLGPVAQLLGIHRGDRIQTLVAMDTRPLCGPAVAQQMSGEACGDFRNGDHTTTLMRTERGKMIEIQHNVMTPQPYSRVYQVMGSRGYACKYPTEMYVGIDEQSVSAEVEAMEKADEKMLKSCGLQSLSPREKMDYRMDMRLVECLLHGWPLDMDVYDLAEWSSLAELGALSMDHHSAPVAFPDFTRGFCDIQ